jgi:hypothetical protein
MSGEPLFRAMLSEKMLALVRPKAFGGLNGETGELMAPGPSALTKMDHVVLTRVDPGSMTKITRGLAALAA